MRRSVIFLSIFLFCKAHWAQESITVDEASAIRMALASSHLRAAAAESVEAAESEMRAKQALRNPQMVLQAFASQRNSVPEFHLPGAASSLVLYSSLETAVGLRFGVTQVLDTSGQLHRQIQGARLRALATQEEASAVEMDIRFQARMAFWEAAAANAFETVADKQLRRAERTLADARNREGVGLGTKVDVLAALAQYEQAKVALFLARANAEAKLVTLRSLLGFSPHQVVKIQPAANQPLPPPPLASLLEEAQKRRPELQSLKRKAQALHLTAQIELAALRPQTTISGQYDFSRPNSSYFPLEAKWKSSWSLNLAGSLTLFDGGHAKARAAAASAQARSLLARLSDLYRQITLEVELARKGLEDALALIPAKEAALQAATAREQAVRDSFLAGLASMNDLESAETALTEADFALEESRFGAWMAQAQLDRSIGQ